MPPMGVAQMSLLRAQVPKELKTCCVRTVKVIQDMKKIERSVLLKLFEYAIICVDGMHHPPVLIAIPLHFMQLNARNVFFK